MNVRILDTANNKDVRLFTSLPFRIYSNNPIWVPPEPGEIEFVMDRNRHPFYQHSEADFIIVESGKSLL